MDEVPVFGGFYKCLTLPLGQVQFKFITSEGEWVASESYATIQTDGTTNNVVEVVSQTKSMFHQAVSLFLASFID